jgi:hypothetical protein
MAAVARDPQQGDYVDNFLAYLEGEWEAVPGLAEEWVEWSAADRFDFSLDWPIREDRLMQVAALAQAGQLSPAQQERFDRLRAIVAQQRPPLDRLFQEAGLPASGPQGAVPPPRQGW